MGLYRNMLTCYNNKQTLASNTVLGLTFVVLLKAIAMSHQIPNVRILMMCGVPACEKYCLKFITLALQYNPGLN